jgi:hypothetical protein
VRSRYSLQRKSDARNRFHSKPDRPAADPFGERRRLPHRLEAWILGARFRFECETPRLLRIARAAFAGLPVQRLSGATMNLTVRVLSGNPPAHAAALRAGLTPMQPLAGGGLLAGAAAGSSFAVISSAARSALVVISPQLLRCPHQVRYELVEFAAYCLAARTQCLLPLHAACVGDGTGAALLIGASGAGKSTLMLHSLSSELQFLAEDSVLVRPDDLLATGLASYVHVRPESLRFVADAALVRRIRAASIIRRRSGVRKYELDLRDGDFTLAARPLPLRALLFLSADRAQHATLLERLPRASAVERLRTEQPYAASQPGWQRFLRRATRLPAFELRRGAHPRESVAAVREVLAARDAARR